MSVKEGNSESEEFLEGLRKDIIHVVAQKLTYDLSNPDQLLQLKPQLTSVINHYLQTEGIALKDEVRLQLIDELYNRLTAQARQSAPVPALAPDENVRNAIASHLAQFLSDEIEGEALANEIARLVTVKCRQDGIEISEAARAQLISDMCRRMNVAPPAEVAAALDVQPHPLDVVTPPPLEPQPTPDLPAHAADDLDPDAPVSPDLSFEAMNLETDSYRDPLTAPTDTMDHPAPAPLPKLRARGNASEETPHKSASTSGKSIPLKALTNEIKRELLFYLSQTMDPTIVGMSDPSQAIAHINYLIGEYCQEHRLTLTEVEIERIIEEILNGEGLEFQL